MLNLKISLPLVMLVILSSGVLNGQSVLTEHTLQLDAAANRPAVSIEDLHWLTGRWLGEGWGSTLEENWNPPMGGAMLATFRMIKDDQVQFSELCAIEQEAHSLIYRVKHFNPGMKGWEEKDEHVAFPLVKLSQHTAYFDGLTIIREGNNITQFLAMKQKDGSYEEHQLNFKLSTATATPSVDPVVKKFSKEGPKASILFVGSYHMSNPGADEFNLESDDVLTDKRQKEIEILVDRLAAFKPTMIAVEAPYMDSATIAKYQLYVNGKKELRRSEEEQIGFRLAKMLGHDSIYPIDVRMEFMPPDFEKAVIAKPEEYGPLIGELNEYGNKAIEQMGTWLEEGTVSDMLYNMNRPEFLAINHELYFRFFFPIVAGDNYAGADLLTNWYKRNLHIMGNLHKIGFTPEDRILVVYGQGHIPIFQQIAESSPYLEVVDVLPYLKD